MIERNSFPNKSGIYQIRNTVNGKLYIGQSVNLRKRRNEHLRKLRDGNNSCVRLQCAWNKYGEAAFEFSVIELCPIEDLDGWENYYLDTLQTWKREVGYNIGRDATASTRGVIMSAEHNAKISRALMGNKHTLGHSASDETRRKMSVSRTGMKRSPASIAKVVAFHKGRKRSEDTIRKIRDSALNRKPVSEETRAKMSAKHKGVKRSPDTIAKTAAAHRGMKRSEETKAKISAALKTSWSAKKGKH